MDLFRKYLLTSAAFAPRNEGDPPTRQRVVDALVDDVDPDERDETELDDQPEDGEAEQEEDSEADQYEPEPEPRPRGRATTRIETLANDNRALREEIAASQARLAALEARAAQPASRQEDQRDIDARYALMSPEERMNDRLERTLAASNRQTQDVLASVQDQTDASAFRVLLREKPQYEKFATTVETRVKELRGKGTPLPREAVLMFLVGEAAVKTGGKPQKKAQSQQRMRDQETRPASGRGDVRDSDRRNAGGTMSAVERRLSNVRI